jgi:hypothetical protein
MGIEPISEAWDTLRYGRGSDRRDAGTTTKRAKLLTATQSRSCQYAGVRRAPSAPRDDAKMQKSQ